MKPTILCRLLNEEVINCVDICEDQQLVDIGLCLSVLQGTGTSMVTYYSRFMTHWFVQYAHFIKVPIKMCTAKLLAILSITAFTRKNIFCATLDHCVSTEWSYLNTYFWGICTTKLLFAIIEFSSHILLKCIGSNVLTLYYSNITNKNFCRIQHGKH